MDKNVGVGAAGDATIETDDAGDGTSVQAEAALEEKLAAEKQERIAAAERAVAKAEAQLEGAKDALRAAQEG